MKSEKGVNERQVFRRFAAVSGLEVKSRSIRSVKPPYPDISCRVAGVPQYFELTRMVHPGSATVMGRHLSQLSKTGSAPIVKADCYDDRAALRDTIARKAGKTHETRGRPVSLLIYSDGVLHPSKMPAMWAAPILEEEGLRRQWLGIWLYDSAYDRIVASWLRL
jgi:hypothetical protein